VDVYNDIKEKEVRKKSAQKRFLRQANFLQRDVFGNIMLLKRLLFFGVGLYSYPRFNLINRTKVEGTEHLKNLPKNNVLIVSNHQTYFADVMSISSVISSVKWGFKNKISLPLYLINPKLNTYYVAAKETMKAGILPRIFEYAGSISIKRTWREAGKDVNRQVELKDIQKIATALEDGWVITFPQGTTKPFAPGRRGTTLIVKKFRPVVVPVVIDGFSDAFDKKGLRLRKWGTHLSLRFKEPLQLDYEGDSDEMLAQIMDAIEQSDKYKSISDSSQQH
jgi:1-acyl-sn-glycerol-3-phosphate acyltransferase